jgi:hypothetical protein
VEVQVLRFEESPPDTLPTLTEYEGGGATVGTIQPEPYLWERIEAYTARRWSVRQCVWTIQGPGDWRPHLLPAENFVVSYFDDATKTWTAATAEETALGFYLPKTATYKITADVGANAGEAPAVVVQAYQRLSAYSAERYQDQAPVGSSGYTLKLGDGLDEQVTRSPNWLARAMQHSGAADLLRSYRRI